MKTSKTSDNIKNWSFSESSSEESKIIQQKLKDYIEAEYVPAQRASFSFSAKSTSKDTTSDFVGGISGFVHWKWVYIGQLWVDEKYRQHGVGRFLLQSLNYWAQEQNFTGIYVDTFSEKTAQFYIQNGFEKFGEIPNFPIDGNTRFFLKCQVHF
jgi:GNAT superfamily N-acetyltransferase